MNTNIWSDILTFANLWMKKAKDNPYMMLLIMRALDNMYYVLELQLDADEENAVDDDSRESYIAIQRALNVMIDFGQKLMTDAIAAQAKEMSQ